MGNHIVRTLVSNGHLPSQSTKSVNINVWSDCSGINSEMFALQTLSDNIKEIIGGNVQWNLYYTCDSDPRSIVFARQNHAPNHVGIDMKQRNFNTGEVWCTLCQRNLPLPKSGIDLYVGGVSVLTMVAKGYSSGLGPSLCGHFSHWSADHCLHTASRVDH